MYVHIYINTYIHIYILREREIQADHNKCPDAWICHYTRIIDHCVSYIAMYVLIYESHIRGLSLSPSCRLLRVCFCFSYAPTSNIKRKKSNTKVFWGSAWKWASDPVSSPSLPMEGQGVERWRRIGIVMIKSTGLWHPCSFVCMSECLCMCLRVRVRAYGCM